ncbi:hypothetical protein ACLMJK_009563 [Lecanora helva]
MGSQLGFIGLGQMGQAMTANLVAKGHLKSPLIIYNRTQQRAEEHGSKIGNCVVARNLEELIDACDVIWTCLVDEEAVSEIFALILKLHIEGKLFVECSTIPPDATSQLAQHIQDKRASFVAMPVFGEPGMAREGNLICVPAGSESCIKRIQPYLDGVICRAVIDLSGENPAKATLLKNIGNVLIMTTIEQIAEALVFAEKSGLGTRHMKSLISTMFPRPPHTVYSSKMVNGDYAKGESIVGVGKAKTLASRIQDLALASKTSLKSYKVAVDHLTVAEAEAGPRCDIMGIYGAVRVESGLPFGPVDSNI